MKPAVTRETLEQLWSDPVNWKYGLFYRCKDDPRVWVPKRQKWRGWTLNFAQRGSIPALIFCIVVVPLPLVLLAEYGWVGTWVWWAVLAGIVGITSLACRHWSSPDRYEK